MHAGYMGEVLLNVKVVVLLHEGLNFFEDFQLFFPHSITNIEL